MTQYILYTITALYFVATCFAFYSGDDWSRGVIMLGYCIANLGLMAAR